MDTRVVDWFTKGKGEEMKKEHLDTVKNELIKGIIEKSNKTKNFKNFADIIYEILEKNKDLKKICADSRLPTCSLFHHLKNTAAVAVCMAIDKGYDKDKIHKIRAAALLHDIGKLESWYKYEEKGIGVEHVKATEEIVRDLLFKCQFKWMNKTDINHYIPRLASRHHRGKWAEGYLPEGDEEIIADADSIASATDRVYDVVCEGVEKGKCEVTIKSKDRIFPHKINFEKCDFSPEDNEDKEIMLGRIEERKVKLSLNEGFDNRKQSAKVFHDGIVDGYVIKYLGTAKKLGGELCLLLLDIQGIQNFIGEAKKLHSLRGGSYIVEEAQKIAEGIIAKEVCPESILFKGGGNLLALIPSKIDKDKLKGEIENKIKDFSKKGLKCKIAAENYDMNQIAGNFDKVLEDIFGKVNEEKNKPYIPDDDLLKVENSREICKYCFKRKAIKVRCDGEEDECCAVCGFKLCSGAHIKQGRKTDMVEFTKEIARDNGWEIPWTLEDIGKNIAVIAMDGNMMGRMFQQTMTPAEYNYKSETFDKKLREIFKEFIRDFCEDNKEDAVNKGYLSIDPLYIGGDDILLITNTKIALKFAEGFIKKIAEKFKFKPKVTEGSPIVTFSAGIAMASHKFPIYFLIRKAHDDLQKKASKAFRKNIVVNDLRLNNLPEGAISFSAVTSAMPSEEDHTFVFPEDNDKFKKLLDYIKYATEEEDKKSLVSLIINTEDNAESKLDTIKYLYARMGAKEIKIKDCEEASEIIENNDMLKALKSAVPMVWHSKEKNE